MKTVFLCIALLCLSQTVYSFENIDLALLNPNQTIQIIGAEGYDLLGAAVSKAGDVNGDGIDDFILGASAATAFHRGDAGIVYVVYGNRSGLPNLDLKNFTQSQGFRVLGTYNYRLGCSVSGAGDVNGDGIDDIIIGAWQAKTNGDQAGAAYVIFGSRNGLPDIDVTNFHNAQGFMISGESDHGALGSSVRGAGDVNGDGIADVVVGAHSMSHSGQVNVGTSYVIFGSRNRLPDIDLAHLTNAQGFRIKGALSFQSFGDSVSGAGDVNGDGIDDIIAGTGGVGNNSISAYVIYGSRNGLPDIALANLTSTQGIRISKSAVFPTGALTASDAGDVNGDGIADVIVGAWEASLYGRSYNGIVYVIYGSSNGLNDIDLDNLTTSQGFPIFGSASDEYLGFSLSSAGDFNKDGIDDILLGAYGSSLLGKQENGAAYVIYGSRNQIANIDLSQLRSDQGLKITGANPNDNLGNSVRSAGDIDGDGVDDLVVGAWGANPLGRTRAGAAYVILSSQQGQSSFEDRIIVQ